jgi:hypothetical protein
MVGYFLGSRLSPFLERNAQGEIGYVREWNHSTGEILRTALGAGFTFWTAGNWSGRCRRTSMPASPSSRSPVSR